MSSGMSGARRSYNLIQPPYGEENDHEAFLRAGLLVLGESFIGHICWGCEGKTRRNQRYTAGCGGGYFNSMENCEYCDSTGLMQHGKAAPQSVARQVILAGRDYLGR
jgi:hypothetical protein